MIGVGLFFICVRCFEGIGVLKIGIVFIFILVVIIGMLMDIFVVFSDFGFFFVGLIWMLFYVGLMFVVVYLIKVFYFFFVVGSKVNIGGVVSVLVVVVIFYLFLVFVGVLFVVFGYVLGIYGVWFCVFMMCEVFL